MPCFLSRENIPFVRENGFFHKQLFTRVKPRRVTIFFDHESIVRTKCLLYLVLTASSEVFMRMLLLLFHQIDVLVMTSRFIFIQIAQFYESR